MAIMPERPGVKPSLYSVQTLRGGLRKGTALSLKREELREIYRGMALVRAVDSRMITLQRQGRITFYGAATGQEAAVIGSGYALDAEGVLTSKHYQICGRPLNTDAHMSNLLLLMAQKMGVETDQFGDSNRVIAL